MLANWSPRFTFLTAPCDALRLGQVGSVAPGTHSAAEGSQPQVSTEDQQDAKL